MPGWVGVAADLPPDSPCRPGWSDTGSGRRVKQERRVGADPCHVLPLSIHSAAHSAIQLSESLSLPNMGCATGPSCHPDSAGRDPSVGFHNASQPCGTQDHCRTLILHDSKDRIKVRHVQISVRSLDDAEQGTLTAAICHRCRAALGEIRP